MKKYFLFLLIFVLMLSNSVMTGTLSSDFVCIYAPDGRSAYVDGTLAEDYYNVGWYSVPVSYIYSADNRTAVIPVSEADVYTQLGWYTEPVMYVYNIEGGQFLICSRELDDYLNKGYYAEPAMYVYSVNGQQAVIFCSEFDVYRNLGWSDDIEAVSSIMVSPTGEEVRVYSADYEVYTEMGYRHKKPVIDPSRPVIALTFDDGPSVHTARIINTMVKYNSKATFFCVGRSVSIYPQTVKWCADEGMEIGNHTYSHPSVTSLSVSGAVNQVTSTSNEIYAAAGVTPTLFRPPYGNINDYIASAVNMPVILWSIDTLDWKTRNAQSTVNSVMSQVKDGDIVLMHDTYSATADAVEMLVPRLVQAGYQLVTVSDLAAYKSGTLVPGKKYSKLK